MIHKGSAIVACIVVAVVVAVYMFALQPLKEGLESTRLESTRLESTRLESTRLEENQPRLNPEMVALKKQIEETDTMYSELKNAFDDQTNRIQANAHMLLSLVRDTPNKTNSITHANVDMNDPSKTRIPSVSL